MRIKELIYNGKSKTDKVLIQSILQKKGFEWLNKAEIENAIIEIKGSKIYWHSGIWYYGDFGYGIWIDGIFKFGTFTGVWHNGKFEGGTFKDGVWMDGIFKNGVIEKGDFRKDINNVLNFTEYTKK